MLIELPTAPLKLAVMETWMAEERCANHRDEQVGPPASYGKGLLQSITLADIAAMARGEQAWPEVPTA